MEIRDERIDGGKAFDWGKASADYAKYRDIYPQEFYDRILERKVGILGQRVLDIGTGTGVLPRNMYRYGARWTATDISENQIVQARRLSGGREIDYFVSSAEALDFPDASFDVITACQCFWYFDHEQVARKFFHLLKPGGRILVLYMAWLPFEDAIARESERLVLKYSPAWSGAGETMHPISIPDCYREMFELVYHEEFPLKVHFTRESWNGRMKACRGVAASLAREEVRLWEQEHKRLLDEIAPVEFDVLHYGALAELAAKKQNIPG